jgi:hypothetical protein
VSVSTGDAGDTCYRLPNVANVQTGILITRCKAEFFACAFIGKLVSNHVNLFSSSKVLNLKTGIRKGFCGELARFWKKYTRPGPAQYAIMLPLRVNKHTQEVVLGPRWGDMHTCRTPP